MLRVRPSQQGRRRRGSAQRQGGNGGPATCWKARARRHPSLGWPWGWAGQFGRYIVCRPSPRCRTYSSPVRPARASVCINAIIVSILCWATPDAKVKLILIDPRWWSCPCNGIPTDRPSGDRPEGGQRPGLGGGAEMASAANAAGRGVRDIRPQARRWRTAKSRCRRSSSSSTSCSRLLMVAPGEVGDKHLPSGAARVRAAGMHWSSPRSGPR